MGMWFGWVDYMLESAHELWFSVDKFLTYAQHVLDEQRKWEAFYKRWHKWASYVSLIKFHLTPESSHDTIVDIDKVIDLLCELLWSDIFETDKKKYVKAFDIYRSLIPFWDKIYRPNHKVARRRAIEVLSWDTCITLSENIHQTCTSVWIEINEVLELFDNFWCLLWEMSKNPSIIYISWYNDSISPHFSEKIQKLMDFLDYWEKSEVLASSQRNMKWTMRGDRLSELEISHWYDELGQKDIEVILLDFGMFLFKKWELDVLPQRNLIVWYLMNLARKISKRRYAEILNIIHLEEYNNQTQSRD